ncbi:Alpha-tubulin [Hexamita inflata]|uniref:Alpha-tubulin n=1 Tax=Hexamita inflata TaxID=28002 RepID=A0AA86NFZ4_9EUKA|nr:Alpha-tubulin [Hexamita inflata]CAI9919024.1 Alpha-tubulin [Hexamita inflata]
MREVINIHVGQAGTSIGACSWQLFCIEHCLDRAGKQYSKNQYYPESDFLSFFTERQGNKFVPRAVFVDTDSAAIDQIRASTLFDPSSLVSSENKPALVEEALNQIRIKAEECDNFQGFVLYRSLAGGTGSRIGSVLLEEISSKYERKTKVEMALFPSKNIHGSELESYNTVLASKQLIESDAVFAFDNESIIDICRRNLGIEAKHLNANKLIAHAISNITAAIRFDGALNVNLQEIETNHVPYPRVNCLVCSNSPFTSNERIDHEQLTAAAISRAIFEPANVMLRCNIYTGKYMACSMVYRGDVVPKDVGAACGYVKTKRTVQFVDWCPTGFKMGINYLEPEIFPESDIARVQCSCMLIANHTSISDVWNRIATNFDILFDHKAFVHHYVNEGVEESEFVEARDNLEEVQRDFDEIIQEEPLDDDNF